MENIYYEEIMKLYGSEEMKAIVKKWNHVAFNLPKDRRDRLGVLIPNLLLRTKSGRGNTKLIRLLSEYLDSVKLMEFHGDIKYYQFLLEYCEPQTKFDELTRLMNEVYSRASGFRRGYSGILAIDITEWKGHFNEEYFKKTLEYLESIDNEVCLIFMVEGFTTVETEELELLLYSHFRIETVHIREPRTEDLLFYCKKLLMESGVTLDEEAQKLLRQTIAELAKTKYFDGYKTMRRMCQDIVFEVYETCNPAGKPLNQSMLSKYKADGVYVQKVKERIKKVKLGF